MKNILFLLAVLFFLLTGTYNLNAQTDSNALPDCEWCGANEAPSDLSWETTITDAEPGEQLVISGKMYKADKTTPAAGVILYIYHTNEEGIYPKKGDEKGNGKRHGFLRSWLKTNERGEFRFNTIRPGSYPNTREPQHVHLTVLEPGKEEYWLKTIFFADDKFLTQKEKTDGYVVKLDKDDEGWKGRLDIVLK
jgi:protocatechuate 3,4-dioxygenase, beta subunit